MKWPNTLTFIRHGESEFNFLKEQYQKHDLYKKFKKRFDLEFNKANDENWISDELKEMARILVKTFKRGADDYGLALTKTGHKQAQNTGKKLSTIAPVPDVIYVSPYLRTRQTLDGLIKGYPKLKKVKVISEERIREQERGLALLYADRRVYLVLNPLQALLFKLEGSYAYRFLNGENVADVRDRVRSFVTTLVREHSEQNVLIVSHHLTLLSLRSTLERWDRETFARVDHADHPINCGVTIYRGHPKVGKNGQLKLDIYNKKLY